MHVFEVTVLLPYFHLKDQNPESRVGSFFFSYLLYLSIDLVLGVNSLKEFSILLHDLRDMPVIYVSVVIVVVVIAIKERTPLLRIYLRTIPGRLLRTVSQSGTPLKQKLANLSISIVSLIKTS